MASNGGLRKPFFILSPLGNLQGSLAIVVFVCLLFGAIMSGIVKENTIAFWRFLNQVSVSEIEKIQVQRVEKKWGRHR